MLLVYVKFVVELLFPAIFLTREHHPAPSKRPGEWRGRQFRMLISDRIRWLKTMIFTAMVNQKFQWKRSISSSSCTYNWFYDVLWCLKVTSQNKVLKKKKKKKHMLIVSMWRCGFHTGQGRRWGWFDRFDPWPKFVRSTKLTSQGDTSHLNPGEERIDMIDFWSKTDRNGRKMSAGSLRMLEALDYQKYLGPKNANRFNGPI